MVTNNQESLRHVAMNAKQADDAAEPVGPKVPFEAKASGVEKKPPVTPSGKKNHTA